MSINRDALEKAGLRFGDWQKRLVFEKKYFQDQSGLATKKARAKILSHQKILIEAVERGPVALGHYLRDELGLTDHAISSPPVPRISLTPSEYQNPPVELERELGEHWENLIQRGPASRPVFWLVCHIDWIEQGRLGTKGFELKNALLASTDTPNREIQTRNFLRRTGGIFVRGNTSVLSDCTLARAWWRYTLAKEVAHASGDRISCEKAHEALHVSRPAWETLVMMSLRRITSLNQPIARSIIVERLVRQLAETGKVTKEQVQQAASALGPLGLRRSLDHTSRENLTAAIGFI